MICSADTLADDRLGDAADGGGAALRGDLDFELQGDVVVKMNGGGDLDVDADIQILELGLYADAESAHGTPAAATPIGTGGDGDALADLHGGFLRVGGANARDFAKSLWWNRSSRGLAVADPMVTRSSTP